MKITTANLKNFRSDFQDAVKELEEKYNVTIQAKNIRFGSDDFRFPVEVRNRTESGAAVNPEEATFKRLAHTYGVSETALGEIFSSRGTPYRLTGLKPSRRKFPFSAVRVADGASFKFTAEQIARTFPA